MICWQRFGTENIKRCTAKRPEDRFQHGRELADFLARAEPKALDLSRARSKAMTFIYDGAHDEAVQAVIRRALADAKKVPGMKVSITETGKLY